MYRYVLNNVIVKDILFLRWTTSFFAKDRLKWLFPQMMSQMGGAGGQV